MPKLEIAMCAFWYPNDVVIDRYYEQKVCKSILMVRSAKHASLRGNSEGKMNKENLLR